MTRRTHRLHLGAQLQTETTAQEVPCGSERSEWEAGKIDYMGADKFENIQRRLKETIGEGKPTTSESQTQRETSPGMFIVRSKTK